MKFVNCILCQRKDAGKWQNAYRRSNTLRGLQKTRLYLDGSLENPLMGAEGVSRWRTVCESLRQKDSEV